MIEEKKWIQDIRDRMDGYSEPLPAGMWDKVEKELGARKVIPLRRKWQMAAAAALIAAVSSLTFWLWTSPVADSLSRKGDLAQKEEKAVLEKTKPFVYSETPEKPAMAVVEKVKIKGEAVPAAPAAVRMAVVAEDEPDKEAETEVSADAQPESDRGPVSAEKRAQDEKKVQLLRASRDADRRQMEQNASWAKKEKSRSGQSWQMSLGAGNAPYSYSNSFGGFGRVASHTIGLGGSNLVMNPLSDEATAYNQVMFNNREQSSRTEVHHRMPVSVGASVKWFFHEDWALESGLFYTILSSDARSGAESYMEEKWKLHYIGIPLKIHRSVWQNERFSFYASAGGAVEKCVSGDLETVYVTGGGNREVIHSSLDVDPLQWSVVAGIGAQVNFTKQFGLYVEPGIAYYFDDGCDIETFRKEHPLTFNLQLGLRFSFLK